MTPASIPSSEFRQNFGKYMALVDMQDFQVTKNGKVIGLWTNPHRDKLALVDRLAGSVHATVDLEQDRAERRDRL